MSSCYHTYIWHLDQRDIPTFSGIKVGPTQPRLLTQLCLFGTTSPGHTARAPPVSTSGLEPGTSRFRDKRINHCATKADFRDIPILTGMSQKSMGHPIWDVDRDIPTWDVDRDVPYGYPYGHPNMGCRQGCPNIGMGYP